MPKLPIKVELVNSYLGKTYRFYVNGGFLFYLLTSRVGLFFGLALLCLFTDIGTERASLKSLDQSQKSEGARRQRGLSMVHFRS
jgi:hypothetical protein